MFLVKLLRFLAGYVRISVTGRYPERFLNLCAKYGIRVWYSHRRGDRLDACVFASDYKKLRRFRRDCGVKLRIRRKVGVPFFCFRYRRRAGLAVGAVLCCAFLAVMPRFVWSIEVHADAGIDPAAVTDALAQLGLSVGTPLNRLDPGNLRLLLAQRVPNVSWAAINNDGTAVTVEVRALEPKEERPDGYANLVAVREGQITAVTVRSGSACVKVGDAVTAGQLLVSATESYTDGTTRFRYADGEIIAQTQRTVTVTVPCRQTVTADAGKPTVRRVAGLFGLRVPLYVGDVSGNVRREVSRRDLVIGGVTLPAWITTATFTPVKTETVTLTASAAKARAEADLSKALSTQLADAEVLDTQITVTCEDGEAVATAHCVCRENIARAEPLSVEENEK